ncbi:PREDICTED: uncharacterized protein LOC109215507 [Nicotiana attenuata]|uniref:uncharacterized protein LOC109215507 n=1 Tax=Nicotiana attenuata TaxID=49451 RepID=UPI000904B298|nr:PREDICTED: uncharacterized protein LOC109215507 [Nicotiana attenuata]
MGMVVVISLPFIIFTIFIGFGCYFLGRAKGRQDLRTNPQVFGVPTPPPGTCPTATVAAPLPSTHFKQDNASNV